MYNIDGRLRLLSAKILVDVWSLRCFVGGCCR